MSSFALYVSYSTLAVFDPALANPYNDWTDAHIEQGFSWRPGSVSFATLSSDGDVTVSIRRNEAKAVEGAVRRIRVPFTVPPDGRVEVGSISDTKIVALPAGPFDLFFETGRDSSGEWCCLTFSPPTKMGAEIVLSDLNLAVGRELIMDAKPG